MTTPRPVRELFTHWNPHAEEIFVIFLAYLCGEDIFPGIRKALVRYIDAGSFFPDADLQLPMLQRLYLGSGGGKFDEHPHPGVERQAGCAATLFAHELGVRNRFDLKKLLDYLESNDLRGNARPFELPSLIKARHPYNNLATKDGCDLPFKWALTAFAALHWAEHERMPSFTNEHIATVIENMTIRWIQEQQARQFFHPGEPRDVLRAHPYLQQINEYITNGRLHGFHPYSLGRILALLLKRYPTKTVAYRWVCEILDVKLREQIDFFDADEELTRYGQVYNLLTPQGRRITLVTIVSNNSQMGKRVRLLYRQGTFRVDILVQRKKSNGHTQIFTDQRSNISLDETARLLRVHEQLKRNQAVVPTTWEELAKEGQIRGAELWHYFRQAKMLLNGTFTSPGTEPTCLTLDEIVSLIQTSFDTVYMERTRSYIASLSRPLS